MGTQRRIEPVSEFEPGGMWPRVVLRFAEVDGRAMLVNVEIGARYYDNEEGTGVDFEQELGAPEPVPVTTSVLRSIPLARLTEQALWEFARTYGAAASGAPEGEFEREYAKAFSPEFAKATGEEQRRRFFEDRAAAARAATAAKRGPGRPRLYDDEHFAEVARVYREHSGGPAPTKAVAESFQTSKATAAKWVARARDMGLLERPERREENDG
jgi:transposase